MQDSKTLRRGICAAAAVACVMVGSAFARDLGVDVSHYQGAGGNGSLSETTYAQMYSQGDRFVFIKASEGLTGPDDTTMSANVANADSAGLLTGVYHFAHPENRPTTAGAVLEADHFVAIAGSAISYGHLRPVLDLETGNTIGQTALTDWVIAFCNEVMAKDGAAADPIIYTAFTSYLETRMSTFDLWLLDQSDPSDPQTANPPAAAIGNFSNWSFWQYNGAGTAGGVSPIDLDVDHSEYKSLASFIITPEPSTMGMALMGGAMMLRRSRRGGDDDIR